MASIRGYAPLEELGDNGKMNNSEVQQIKIESPVGLLTLTSNGENITGLDWEAYTKLNTSNVLSSSTYDVLNEAKRQLDAYFSGSLKSFDLPIHFDGTDFQTAVWRGLTQIPYGETISYGELASRVGNSKASRAVGMANHFNPIGIIVPCHRVIGANGKLTGYAGGLWRKQYLLDLERCSGAALPQIQPTQMALLV
jgi:methylated-DNA-[protein]-cysteine S-methyltransferase